jgi:hypothetical protein
MTLYEFNRLELNEHIEAVNQYGTFLNNYLTKDIRINCYAINKFFIEIVFDSEHKTIKEDGSFKSRRHLEKYAPKC